MWSQALPWNGCLRQSQRSRMNWRYRRYRWPRPCPLSLRGRFVSLGIVTHQARLNKVDEGAHLGGGQMARRVQSVERGAFTRPVGERFDQRALLNEGLHADGFHPAN